MVEEVSVAMGTPIEGFFDRANMVVEFMASVASTAAQGVPAKTLIPFAEPIPVDEGTHTKRVSEPAFIPSETPTSQKGVTSQIASLPEIEPPTTLLVISMSDPFAALSQAIKDGSSLVVTPSSIPGFATHGPNADLSFKDSEEVFEDSDDEPTMKKKVSDSDEEGVMTMRSRLWVHFSHTC